MVEKSSFLGCFNPCKFGFQNFSLNQVRPAGFGLFEQAFPNDMGECEVCKTRFTFLKRKKICNDCGLNYCSACLTRISSGHWQCRKCKILSCWPINKAEVSSLRVRDLRHFLGTCKIPTNTYKEKQELIDLVIAQLRIKHVGRSYDYHRNFSRPEGSTNAATSSTSTTSTTRDDGIRVRPHSTNFDEDSLATTSAEAGAAAASFSGVNLPGDIDDDSTGIRVFAYTREGEAASSAATQTDTNHENSDDTSSSSWSLLQLEETHISSSSESLSHSSGLENSSTNIPPDNEEDILQEVHMPSQASNHTEGENVERPPTSNPNEAEAVESQENAHQPARPTAERKQTVVADVIKLSSLADEGAIKELSVRQCKEILILHRVDFSGVWEKHELVNKVIMVWKDFKERQGEKDWSEDQLCKICMDAAIDCVLLECGHMLACTNCGKQMAECPICRQNVVRVVKTFRA